MMIASEASASVHVGLGDAADARLQQLDFHFRMLELGELLFDRLDRAADVGPQDQVERLHFGRAIQSIEEGFERDVAVAAAAERRGPFFRGARLGDLAGLGDVVEHVEALARAGGVVEAGDVHRDARPGLGRRAGWCESCRTSP